MIIYQPSRDLIFNEFDESEYWWANYKEEESGD